MVYRYYANRDMRNNLSVPNYLNYLLRIYLRFLETGEKMEYDKLTEEEQQSLNSICYFCSKENVSREI